MSDYVFGQVGAQPLKITIPGIIGAGRVTQADWAETDPNAWAYIKNKPTTTINTEGELPETGEEGVVYIVKEPPSIYLWSNKDKDYSIIGADVENMWYDMENNPTDDDDEAMWEEMNG